MKRQRLAIASIVAAAALVAGVAQAETLAGWDFSQYASDGLLTTDGSTFSTTLPANYSSFDPSFNAGSEAASYGTATLSGSILPTAAAIRGNRDGAAFGFGSNGFDSFSVLKAEGQMFRELMALTTMGAGSVTFEADLSSVPDTATDWEVSFGGKTLAGTSTVTVEFSADGGSFTSFGSVQLDTDDRVFSVALDPAASPTGFVRLGLDASSGQPIIDNVAIRAIPVPEPELALGLVAGLLVLLALQRARR